LTRSTICFHISLRTIGYQEIFAKAISRLNRRRENGRGKKGIEKVMKSWGMK
jgi:hypothetical protein